MKIEKDPSGVLKLLDIAADVEALAIQASQESQASRIAGRLARDPHIVEALSEAIVNVAMSGDRVISILTEIPTGPVLLHCAMRVVSMHLWEEMWNTVHPDQFGLAWEGEDFDLRSVWREKVQAMMKERHLGAILATTPEEYFDQLTAAGLSDELAKAFADWISEVQGGHTPST